MFHCIVKKWFYLISKKGDDVTLKRVSTLRNNFSYWESFMIFSINILIIGMQYGVF